MLQITHAAMSLLRTVLASEESPEDVFRLVGGEDSLALARVPEAEEGDLVYEQDGVPVLATSLEVAEDLKTLMIDLEANSGGTRLIVVSQ